MYYCFFPVRDGVKHIAKVIDSIVFQSVKPGKIIVVDDGSTDGTSEILYDYKQKYGDLIEIIRTENKTRDYKRLPELWNLCLLKDYKYHMITAGDISIEQDYAKKILDVMEKDDDLVIVSGDYEPFTSQSPHGAGRFVRQSFFYDIYKDGKYPLIVGYESEILVRVMMKGKKLEILNDVKFNHLDTLGHGHNFSEFGYGMRALGYNPTWCILRCIVDAKRLGLKGSWNMFKSYVTYRPQKDGYYSMFDQELRTFMNNYQSIAVKMIILSWILNILVFKRKFMLTKKLIPKKMRKKIKKMIFNYKKKKLAKIGIFIKDDQV